MHGERHARLVNRTDVSVSRARNVGDRLVKPPRISAYGRDSAVSIGAVQEWSATSITRFTALGDSITEGMCDTSRQPDGRYLGWADRLAMILAGQPGRREPLQYANLAVRSRKVDHVLREQIPQALAMRADFVTILIGANDLANYRSDPDLLCDRLESGVALLRRSGAQVMLATLFDPLFRFMKPMRRRAAVFNANLWGIAAQHGAMVFDLWNVTELAERDMWAEDRVHLSSAGHRVVAYRAAERLGVEDARALSLLESSYHEGEERLTTAQWLRQHAAPWVRRRLRGVTAGDGMVSKHLELEIVRPLPAVDSPHESGRQAGLDRLRDDGPRPVG